MHKLPQYFLIWVILFCIQIPSLAQIDPIKAAKDLGRGIPTKKDVGSGNTGTNRPAAPASTTSANNPITADPAAESSPAKSYISSFWKSIERLKALSSEQKYNTYYSYINSAETSLHNIKTKDAAYDTKPLEAELEKYKAEEQAFKGQQLNTRDNTTNTVRFLSDLFNSDQTSFTAASTGSLEQEIPKHQERLQAFTNKVNQFLISNPDPARVKEWENQANQDASGIPAKVAEMEKNINEHTSKGGLTIHRDLVGLESYWAAIAKIYPNLSAPTSALQSIKAALGHLGSNEQMMAQFKQNEVEKIKNTKMPPAVMVNAALEADFKKAFAETGWQESILKINLQTRDWTTLYHNITGNIICRVHEAVIAAKQKDGNCILYSFSIAQEYTGAGKYGPSRLYKNGVLADKILCANVK